MWTHSEDLSPTYRAVPEILFILGVNAHEEFGVKSILIMQAHYAGSLCGLIMRAHYRAHYTG